MKATISSRQAMVMVLGQPSWRLANNNVELCVTEQGGHVGPVTFNFHGRRIQPMSVAPWAHEKIGTDQPPVIRTLRGDFFCLPFGGNETPCRGERHPPHGETASARWRRVRQNDTPGRHTLHLRLSTRIRPGTVDKLITLVDRQTMVYQQHIISGMSGAMNYGHHAMLHFPDKENSGIVSTSRFVYGQVFVEPLERPENRGYSILQPGARFDRLDRVPTITGQMTDLSRYPARRGYEDLVMLAADRSLPLAWSAVTFPQQRYVWFALKNPRQLPQTILWLSNGGRHYPPWNGRHVNVLGIEEVCGYFHLGLAESVRQNPLSACGIPTSFKLRPDRPLSILYAFGVARIPAGFDRVADIVAGADGHNVLLRSMNGKSVSVAMDGDFLWALMSDAMEAAPTAPGRAGRRHPGVPRAMFAKNATHLAPHE